MTTEKIIRRYFDAIHGGGWESYIGDEFDFVNGNLDRAAHGKRAYLEAAGRFFDTTANVEIRQLLIEKERVAVLARYQVRSPGGENGVCDVAEFLTVRDGKIVSSAIFFDTGALAALMSR